MANKDRGSSLSANLQRLETQIGRLTELLAEQAAAKKRRRLLTIRFLLFSFVGFAAFFAWAGSVYHQSRRQSRAVDQLIDQGAFVLYSPNQSTLISILPGDSRQPPQSLVNAVGDDFFRSVTNVSTAPRTDQPRDKQKIIAALSALPRLKLLRLTNLGLRTGDLSELGNLRELQSLDLTRTGLDSGEMPWLAQSQLRWLKASHTQFSDRALAGLLPCRQLQYLDLERTTVTDAGIGRLGSMPNLRYLNLKRCPVSGPAVKRLSDTLPGCVIEWEPLRFRPDGTVDSRAAQQGRVRHGRSMPKDPRESRRAIPPMDSAPLPTIIQRSNGRQGYRNGYQLDVF